MQDVSPLQWPGREWATDARLPAVLLIGMPGAGKGTQGSLIGELPGLFHISTGEILRSLEPDDPDYELVHSRIDFGNFVPDDEMLLIWQRWLSRQISARKFDPDRDIMVLDGLPRTVTQCRRLEPRLDVLGVIHLESPQEEPIIERLLARAALTGRPDDASVPVIRHRFEVYRKTTQPILDYYPDKLIHQIDPLGSPQDVKRRILDRIHPMLECVQNAGWSGSEGVAR